MIDQVSRLAERVATGVSRRGLLAWVGASRWVRTQRGVAAAATTVGQWFIDPTNGDDSHAGTSAVCALKTHAELSRRWNQCGVYPLLPGVLSTLISPIQRIVVNILGSLPATDPIDFQITLPANTLLAYVGTPVTVRAGTLTAVTAKNRATNTPWDVADAVTPFSAADIGVGRRLRITSGANAGQFAWFAKDLGGGVLRMSSFSTPTMPGVPDVLIQTGLTAGIVAIGDPYVVETLPQVTIRSMDVRSPLGGTNTNTIAGFANLDFRNTGGAASLQPNLQGTVTGVFKGCRWDGLFAHGRSITRHSHLNCCFDGGLTLNLVAPAFRGGLSRASVLCRGGISALDDDFMVQGGARRAGILVQNTGLTLGAVCVFDSVGDGVIIGGLQSEPAAASCFTITGFSGTHQLWGSGNGGVGLNVTGASKFVYQTNVPNITGMGGDFKMSGAASSRAWDETASAYTALVANTWANLAATIGAGGFGGNAHNVERSADLVKI